MTVKPGDKVITSKYAGTKVTLEDVEYMIVTSGRHSGHRRLTLKGELVPSFDSPHQCCALVNAAPGGWVNVLFATHMLVIENDDLNLLSNHRR